MANEKNHARCITFTNKQTGHFFRWVMYSGKVPVNAVIDRAWEIIRENDDYIAKGEALLAEVDVNEWLCEEMAPLLKEILENAAGAFCDSPEHVLFYGVEEDGMEEYLTPETMTNARIDQLVIPILIEALRGIDVSAVAKAILMTTGRWIGPEKIA